GLTAWRTPGPGLARVPPARGAPPAVVHASGPIDVSATSVATIEVLALGIAGSASNGSSGGGGGGFSFTGAGSGAGNTVKNTVSATLAGATSEAGGAPGGEGSDDKAVPAAARAGALL